MKTVEAPKQGDTSSSKKPAGSVMYWWWVSAGKACAPSLAALFKVLANVQFPGSHSPLRK